MLRIILSKLWRLRSKQKKVISDIQVQSFQTTNSLSRFLIKNRVLDLQLDIANMKHIIRYQLFHLFTRSVQMRLSYSNSVISVQYLQRLIASKSNYHPIILIKRINYDQKWFITILRPVKRTNFYIRFPPDTMLRSFISQINLLTVLMF